MSVTAQRKEIIQALKSIPGVRNISAAWPEGKDPIPCITVDLASKRATDRRDDKPYLTQTEFYVRLFAVADGDFESIGGEIEARMEELGYEQTFGWEEPGPGVRQLAFRYQKTN
ncbi:MAG: hypothetical protein VB099_20965 [Candidatus Limiplasma sp.]|nr:hypothetical protein [Candidatus Limiplasma sp.]